MLLLKYEFCNILNFLVPKNFSFLFLILIYMLLLKYEFTTIVEKADPEPPPISSKESPSKNSYFTQ